MSLIFFDRRLKTNMFFFIQTERITRAVCRALMSQRWSDACRPSSRCVRTVRRLWEDDKC